MSAVETLYAAVGWRICEARQARSLTQAQLAVGLDVTRSSVANIEAGRQRTSIHVLVAIAQALDVPVASLLGDELPMLAPPLPPDVERIRWSLKGLRDELDAALAVLDGRGRHRADGERL